MKALTLFSSHDGQAQKIILFVADKVKSYQECDVINILHIQHIDWTQYDRVLIGASIRYGHFQSAVAHFVKNNLVHLHRRVSGFFSVNLMARKVEHRTLQTNAYTHKFLLQSQWHPDICAVFAGALRYPIYSWFDRFMIQLIMWITNGETDTTKEIEYTDWQQVELFSKEFAQMISKSY